ncbi:hypothetical protein QEZ47_21020 [Aminobacter anthyllidis]|uniref:hypothetical protein n=1 Tax=Aminobacter anthyllidis TaxID=1035067 RepID=UPI0024584498|nr:hypothetical protein [Aminobacter anthyllidis]MDH4987955.1 hypothetical protein [Aminobacter anthyllidis]
MPKRHPLRSLKKRVAKFRYHDVEVIRAKLNRRLGKEEPYQVHQGARHHPGGVYAIFLIWQPKETPWYVDNALASLDESQANVILVVNHDLDPERLLDLSQRCSKIIIRNNSGFDIGGYRDATLYLLENEHPARLIYLNDSVYFFKKGLTGLFQDLAGSQADVTGSFENWQHAYHVQSFCFSVSQRDHQKLGVLKVLDRLPSGQLAPVGDPKGRDRILQSDSANSGVDHLHLHHQQDRASSRRDRPRQDRVDDHLSLPGDQAPLVALQE